MAWFLEEYRNPGAGFYTPQHMSQVQLDFRSWNSFCEIADIINLNIYKKSRTTL